MFLSLSIDFGMRIFAILGVCVFGSLLLVTGSVNCTFIVFELQVLSSGSEVIIAFKSRLSETGVVANVNSGPLKETGLSRLFLAMVSMTSRICLLLLGVERMVVLRCKILSRVVRT